jgi:Xaa-Pro aminopeptidase
MDDQRPSQPPDIDRMNAYRLGRLRAELKKRDLAGMVVVDAINLRYATGSRNMQLWTLRSPARYAFVGTEGPLVMFEFAGCHHLLTGLKTIDEIRTATGWFYFTSGGRLEDKAKRWAAELADLVQRHGGGNKRLAVDRINPEGYAAFKALGIEVVDGQEAVEHARALKSPDEILCLQEAIAVCERGFAAMEEAALVPGRTETEIWSRLHAVNIAEGGEYIETRLLSSGLRTNPWFQEANERHVQAGDLIACDSDLIGRHGYFADMSRTFLCGEGKATGTQRSLFQLAEEQIQHNTALLQPGISLQEVAEKSWDMPELYLPHRYMSLVHGAGLCGEYPYVPYRQDYAAKGYRGSIEAGMTLCVESFIGASTGGEGVKLEELVLVTEQGAVPLTSHPYDRRLAS